MYSESLIKFWQNYFNLTSRGSLIDTWLCCVGLTVQNLVFRAGHVIASRAQQCRATRAILGCSWVWFEHSVSEMPCKYRACALTLELSPHPLTEDFYADLKWKFVFI